MPISRKTKRIAWGIGALVLLALLLKLAFSALFPTDLRSELARVLGVKAEVLWVNLPPAKNRRPGAAFVYQSTLLAIDGAQSEPDDVVTGSEFELGWVNSTASKLNGNAGAGILGLLYGDRDSFKVRMRGTKCRSVEVPLDKLKQRLLKSEAVRDQVIAGREPLVVVRSYEGIVTLRVERGSAATAEAWSRAKSSAKEAAGFPGARLAVQGESDDVFEMTFKDPIVFAYEMVAARLVATHLGTEPNDVQFTPVPEPGVDLREGKSSDAAPPAGDPRRWALATATVGSFPKTPWLQQEWNGHSAISMRDVLRPFAPSVVAEYATAGDHPSSAERLLRFAADTGHRARSERARMLVFYYVGHTVTTPDGDILLLQSGATPDFLKSIGAGAGRSDPGPLGDLVRALEPPRRPPDGTQAVRLAELHAALADSGLPFVLLLDGCMDNGVVRQTVEGAGFRYDAAHPSLFYAGAAPLTQRLIDQVGNSLRDFGARAGYLRDANPIVFAAKPGTLAMIGNDPLWEGAPPLAPLAAKFKRMLAPSADGAIASLAELTIRAVDMRQGVGEIELSGSISWSDFSRIEQAGDTLTPARHRMPFTDSSVAVSRRLEPGIGPIEGFYYHANERNYYLLSQGNDWKVWRWSESATKRLLISDIHFPKISGTQDGTVYLHHDDDQTLAVLEPSGKLRPVRAGLYLSRMGIGTDAGDLLLAAEASSVDEWVPAFRLRAGAFVDIGRLRASGLLSIAAFGDNAFAYTREGVDAVLQQKDGVERRLASGLQGPGQLVRADAVLYCLSRTKARLYMLSGTDLRQAELLRQDGAQLLERARDPDGLQATPEGTLLMTSGNAILELNPAKLVWYPVPRT